MKQAENYDEEHSEEVRDIMSQQANWMVRWGAALLVLIVAVVLSVFIAIRYPVFVTVPFQVSLDSNELTADTVIGEATVPNAVYRQIEVGQQVQVSVPDSLWENVGRVLLGQVTDKRPGGQIRLLFPVGQAQQQTYRTTLQQARQAKIKTGEKRLISQFSELFTAK